MEIYTKLSCMMINIILSCISLTSAVRTSKFVGAGFVDAMYSPLEISDAVTETIYSAIDCGRACSNLPSKKCTRFRFCQQEVGKAGNCTMYEHGDKCIMGDNGGPCSCFMVKYIMEENGNCTCAVGYYGNGDTCCKIVLVDCTDGVQQPHLTGRQNLLAFIKPVGYSGDPFQVLCKFDSRGWTYISSRLNTGSILNFNRPWIDYVQGFDNAEGSFWLGLNKTFALLQTGGRMILDINLFYNNENCSLKYDIIYLNEEVNDFVMNADRLNIEPQPEWCSYFQDNVDINGMAFATYDNDNGCASGMQSGWWFNDVCTNFNPNAPYNNDTIPTISGSQGQPQLDIILLSILRIPN